MIVLIIISLIYVLSTFCAYKFIQYVYYHPKGRSNVLDPDTLDNIMIFLPIVNFFMAMDFLLGYWKDAQYRKSNFFKPKKPLK